MSFKPLSRDSDNNILLPTKSKRSQSALEYMMTYGWAILIIVIVAVILYSMGIFNPSSSITFTSSGFSPFTVSSSLCNNLGYKIAVLAGPIPNNANSLQIDKVYLTSATGANATTASYTLKNPVTLKSGQSATILIPNVACNAANVHYSISANIQYSYTASTLGLQTVNTTGTVAGTSISGKPSVLTSYEPVTITNSQSSATPSPFQQMVNFTSSDPGWASISTGNFGQNVEFFYYNGTVIPSWLENYTSDNATWWLKIAAIPAGSSETVYVGFASTSTNLFNTVNDGEAPELSSTYAEYDDGAALFNYYQRFGDLSSLPSGWTSVGDAVIIYNKDDIKLYSSDPCVGGVIGSNSISVSLPLTYEFYGTMKGNSCGNYLVMGNFGLTSNGNLYAGSNYETYPNSIPDPSNISNPYIYTFNIISSDKETASLNGASISYTWSSNQGTPSNFVFNSNNGAENGMVIYWAITREYPPNGVMPSVSFGSVA